MSKTIEVEKQTKAFTVCLVGVLHDGSIVSANLGLAYPERRSTVKAFADQGIMSRDTVVGRAWENEYRKGELAWRGESELWTGPKSHWTDV